jgi:hypothetical protein
VLIRNFKAIHEIELPPTTGAESGEELDPSLVEPTVRLEPAYGVDEEGTIERAQRWWTLLGENGSGKSSILQAIGLALAAGELHNLLNKSRIEWKTILRRPAPGGEEVVEGQVFVEFSDGTQIDLRFDREKHWWVGGVPEVQAFVRGYGATRLLASGYVASRDNVRVDNLFDPRAKVTDAKGWLLDLSEPDFNVVAAAISGLLRDDSRTFSGSTREGPPASGPESTEQLVLTRSMEMGEVRVDGLALELASDGYRAIVAMVCDIMSGLGEGLSSMENAPGIVLIDEIGSHLHPRWRMAITPKLRRMLPQVQFLVSTHEPLCLRGLFEREVTRVRKDPRCGVYADLVERSPSSYRVDQLLTSEFFGLDTTIEPDLERRFHHYYRLLAKSERSPEETATLNELYRYLQKNARPALGYTRRDQLLYDQIDQLLSEEYGDASEAASREAFFESKRQRRRQALARVRDIWERRAPLSELRTTGSGDEE